MSRRFVFIASILALLAVLAPLTPGGDAGAAPTEEKNEAWNREHHPEDAEWLWQVWLGPALAAAS